MPNPQNLKPNSLRTKEELQAMGKKGAQVAAANRKRRQTMRDILTQILDITVKRDKSSEYHAGDFSIPIEEALTERGITNFSIKEKSLISLADKMAHGDTRAILLAAKILGEVKDSTQEGATGEGDGEEV